MITGAATARAAEEALTPVAFFNRCYQHLTQTRPDPSHPLRLAVAAGTMAPLDACMAVLDTGRLQGNYQVNLTNQDSLKVLRTLNDLHRSFFPNDNMHAALPVGDYVTNERLQHDQQEGGLHYTYALFGPSVAVSNVVTGTSAMGALRSGGQIVENILTTATATPGGRTLLNAPLVQTGELLGVQPIETDNAKRNLNVKTELSPLFQAGYQYGGTFVGDIRVNESGGAGAIATKSYMLLNFMRQDMKTMDGGHRMPRVWAKAVFKDVLCRDVPVLRTTDGALYVQPNVAGRPPFRLGASCMSCHASMDGMAATVRNYSASMAPVFDVTITNPMATSLQMAKWTPNLPREVGLVDSDPGYHLRPPAGRLVFRTHTGALVDREVIGPTALGQAIADTDDFYACTASRYFEFFTGIQVRFQDPGSATATARTAEEQAYYDRVVALGKSLRQSQSLRRLIQDIFQSDLYKVPSMRLWGIPK